MINKFDTYSDIMTDHCMGLSRWIFEMSAISRYVLQFIITLSFTAHQYKYMYT